MCGIAGALGDLRGVDTRAMREALAHRGPDDEGEVTLTTADAAAALARPPSALHRRPRATRGTSPCARATGVGTIVFNGEVYNFRALRAELEALGHALPLGLRHRGDPRGLRPLGQRLHRPPPGDVRVCPLGQGGRDTLTLARDRLGEKPLYFHRTRERTLFASEVRALLAGGFAARELDDEGLDAFLPYGSAADPFTLVHGVRRVGAGEVLTLRGGDLARRRYWSLARHRAPPLGAPRRRRGPDPRAPHRVPPRGDGL